MRVRKEGRERKGNTQEGRTIWCEHLTVFSEFLGNTLTNHIYFKQHFFSLTGTIYIKVQNYMEKSHENLKDFLFRKHAAHHF